MSELDKSRLSAENNQEPPSEETVETNPIHEDFIQSAPEELRDAASQLAPVWDTYVQKKFQENADFRKSFDGFTQEELSDYQAFKELQNDPAKLKEWHDSWGAVLQQQHPELFQEQQQEFDEYSDFSQPDPRLTALEQQLQQQNQWIEQQQQHQVMQEAETFVTGELDKIKSEYPDLTQEDMDAICTLASRYVPDNPNEQPPDDLVQKGFKDFQSLVGRTERSLFEKKSNQPTPAQHGGGVSSNVEPVTDFGAAAEAARRLIIQSQKA